MITGSLKSRVDKLWEEFWTGGITNPLPVIEQISFLMFARMLDIRENVNERKAQRLGNDKAKMIFGPDEQNLRWSTFRHYPPEKMLKVVRDKVFPHFQKVGRNGQGKKTTFSEYMANAQCLIQKPSLLASAVSMVHDLPIEDTDAKGDLYEYLLSKLTTAGINGQFRTPRHIIRVMVEMVEPKPTDVICDPACGTGGFLVAALNYLYEKHTSEEGIIEREDENGRTQKVFTGDELNPDEKKHIHNSMIFGFDFDATMLRLACMNLILHGIENPNIHYSDSLSNAMPERFPQLAEDHFDLVLANPPFKGSLDYSDVHSSLTGKVKTKKTELLFVALMLRMLRTGGRCAVIVPDGVLFSSSKAHRTLRQTLVEQNQLEAVVSLPGGVFRPYAGVSTAVLVFAKGGKTENVFYYDVQADGLSLDDKRQAVEENDIPDVLEKWHKWNSGEGKKDFEDRTAKAFLVPREDIAAQKYHLSIGRYKEHVYEEVKYDKPEVIVGRLRAMEDEIATDLETLEGMLQ